MNIREKEENNKADSHHFRTDSTFFLIYIFQTIGRPIEKYKENRAKKTKNSFSSILYQLYAIDPIEWSLSRRKESTFSSSSFDSFALCQASETHASHFALAPFLPTPFSLFSSLHIFCDRSQFVVLAGFHPCVISPTPHLGTMYSFILLSLRLSQLQRAVRQQLTIPRFQHSSNSSCTLFLHVNYISVLYQ